MFDDQKMTSWAYTVPLLEYGSTLLTDNIHIMRAAVGTVLAEQPVQVDAWVVLPDHMRLVWTVSADDFETSDRLGAITARFARALAKTGQVCNWGKSNAISIKSEEERRCEVRACLMAPVKEGLVEKPTDWDFSSIHRDIRDGRFDPTVLEAPAAG